MRARPPTRVWRCKPTARAVAERLLYGAVDLLTDPRYPPGCLMVQGALACGEGTAAIRQALAARRAARAAAIRQRLERAVAEGDLPARAHAADLADYITTVIHGMAVQAAGGASREALQRVAQMALRAWPG